MNFPRLFDDGQYSMDQYQNNLGLGTLIDATSCKVTEGLNGEYELELTYPLTGELFSQLQPGRIIVAKPYRNAATVQPFEIYDDSRAIGGQVKFHAQHISYRALGIPIRPVTAQNASAAVSLVVSNAVISSLFTLTTDMTASGTFAMDISIHAPREGSDFRTRWCAARCCISIHAPREGSDARAALTTPSRSDFYPRSPRGERHRFSSKGAGSTGISIHAPREGSDLVLVH